MANDASDDAMSNVLEANDEADYKRDHVQSVQLPSMPGKRKLRDRTVLSYLIPASSNIEMAARMMTAPKQAAGM